MKAHRKTLFRVVSLLLTLALLLPISGPVSAVPSVYAVTQSEIDDLKEQADDLDNQREQLQQLLCHCLTTGKLCGKTDDFLFHRAAGMK